ncbi:MAG: hypothetical protein L3J84_10760 [Gammaproteobacteria bacterium]|nr:hypothetical protein [Gammaproteobacteria bacterium]
MLDFSQKMSIRLPVRPPVKMAALTLLLVLVGSLPGISEVYAGSCAYREAMMALEKGNAVRGLALMRMASRDGDHRAERYLGELGDDRAGLPVFVKNQQSLTLASASHH